MSAPIRWPLSEDLVQAAIATYGRAEEYFEDRFYWDPERVRRVRDERLRQEVARAAGVPFYRRRWEEAGFDWTKFRGLEDLHQIPAYTIGDIRDSIALAPPYGDYQAVIPGPSQSGLRMYFSGGTTGRQRPTVYTAWDRIAGALISARGLYAHGARPGQILLNSYAYSTHNGAWIIDEAAWWWMGITPITTSTGVVSSTAKQLELAAEYGAATIMTTSDYLVHLRRAADELGYKREDFSFEWFSTIGDIDAATRAWDLQAYEYYAFHEVQMVAFDCPHRTGMHVFDDAFVVEVVDTDTGESLAPGKTGNLVITCLYKTGSPQVRYNIQDLSAIVPGTCACGSTTSRITRLAGRSDTMVKVRGINVWPEAVGAVLEETLHGYADYFCVAYREGPHDSLRVFVEASAEAGAATSEKLEESLKDKLGVKLPVVLVGPGALDPLTLEGQAAKLRRFTDERASREPSPAVARLLQ
jgi:phenylacetate-CoA ligase